MKKSFLLRYLKIEIYLGNISPKEVRDIIDLAIKEREQDGLGDEVQLLT